ncbi:TetR family transcriptional regulator [Pseudonocardia sp. ICBG162]|uniref:TetR family transcriptional regulator n=1 Tax=Pseudonocardia sp. ICBG162 TaxID=2846761 RepID=UPI001CF61496|nr:TetR family transcriptional regulator [Pseudonocardia sp. ICBG162]
MGTSGTWGSGRGDDVTGATPGGRRRETRDDGVARTRAALLAAAADVFAERGYDGASVDEIARAAGVWWGRSTAASAASRTCSGR